MYDDRKLTREPLSSFEPLRKMFYPKESLGNSLVPVTNSKESLTWLRRIQAR